MTTAPSVNGGRSSQHPNLRILRGTQPGLLDPSQPTRLLRFPDSKLAFASFDPRTALVEDPDATRPNDSGNLAPPKRIVIETTSKGISFWRFVPRARLEEGVQDEGIWPRVVDVCGEKVQCYQEQWEIYKLDAKYHCAVYPWPRCSTVAWVDGPYQELNTADPDSGKRTRWLSPETSESATQKKARSRPPFELDESNTDSDEGEVEEIVIGNSSQKSKFGRRLDHTSREKIKRARLERWAKHRMANEKQSQNTDTALTADESFSMQVDSEDIFPSQSIPWSTEENYKRKCELISEFSHDGDRISRDQSPRVHKRTRTSPPRTHKRVSQSPDKRRLDRLRRHAELNRHRQEKKLEGSLRFTFAPREATLEEGDETPITDAPGTHSHETNGHSEPQLTAEQLREAEIAESIRKLRELEKDRPMWEEQRKHREARERAEEQEQRARGERRRQEEAARLRQQREATEQKKRSAAEEVERLAREEEFRAQYQQRQRQRWESGPWTPHRALEHYRELCEEFDAAKFTSIHPIMFEDIPWPVLQAPSRLKVEDVDWAAVEAFFSTVKTHMRLQDYKEFVEKSHRRFHPDRWRARRIWAAVTDEIERGYLEVAANTVAQAITPIWRGIKD